MLEKAEFLENIARRSGLVVGITKIDGKPSTYKITSRDGAEVDGPNLGHGASAEALLYILASKETGEPLTEIAPRAVYKFNPAEHPLTAAVFDLFRSLPPQINARDNEKVDYILEVLMSAPRHLILADLDDFLRSEKIKIDIVQR